LGLTDFFNLFILGMTDFIGGFCANYVFLQCQKGFKENCFVKENEEFCRIFF
jgi:hypothetical protein